MPIVRFYLLPQHADLNDRLQLTCQLTEKAYQAGLKTVIVCASDNLANELDQRLWSFSRSAFIPHARFDDPLHTSAAATLLVPPDRISRADVQIDLSDENCPDIPARCGRIFEIVTQHPPVLAATRQRFLFYKQRQWQPEVHKL